MTDPTTPEQRKAPSMSTNRLTDDEIARLRQLLDAVACCDNTPDFGIENWGGETSRTHRVTTHAQVPLARCNQGHEGMLHPESARLLTYAVNALPKMLDEIEAAREVKP